MNRSHSKRGNPGRNTGTKPAAIELDPQHRRSDVTYQQLDKVLRSLSFTKRLSKSEPAQIVYEHKASGAIIMIPSLPDTSKVIDFQLIGARVTLDQFGLMDPKEFDAELQRAS